MGGSLSCIAMCCVAFDIETTGLHPERGDRIIEIGAIEIRSGILGNSFHRRINIKKAITRAAFSIHGITREMLIGQYNAEDAMHGFMIFIGTKSLVAYNAPFDVGFLTYELHRIGLFLNNKCLCAMNRAKRMSPSLSNYRLDTVAKHLGISVNTSRLHHALDDAKLTALSWLAMRDR